VVAELARAIDSGTKGTVLAGPSESSLTGGAVAELRGITFGGSNQNVIVGGSGGSRSAQ